MSISVTVTNPGVIGAAVSSSGAVTAAVSSGGAVSVAIGATVAWDSVTNRPAEFPPEAHTHTAADISDRESALVTSVNGETGAVIVTTGASSWEEITGKPTTFPPDSHTHSVSDLTDLVFPVTSVNGLTGDVVISAEAGASTWEEITGKPIEFPPEAHTHLWSEITATPATFPPDSHTHDIADITGLQAELDGKADSGHSHSYPVTSVNGLTGDVVIEAGGGGLSWSAAPAAPDDTATAGSIAYDAEFLYVATDTNTWRRVALSTWASGSVDEYFDNVALLLHMDSNGGTFFDSSGTPKTIVSYGDATQSATESKFGGKSAYFDGVGDYLSLSYTADLDFGQEPFTIELWLNAASLGTQTLYAKGSGVSGISRESALSIINSTTVQFYHGVRGSSSITRDFTLPVTLSANTWYHLAFTRDSNSDMRLFVDGVASSNVFNDNNVISGNLPAYIGVFWAGAIYNPFNGYIDELRITKGVARYTANFTPPTEAFQDQGGGGSGGSATSYTVANAGSSAVNGTYTESGTNEGRPVYAQDGGSYFIRFVTVPESMWVIDQGDGYQPVYDNFYQGLDVPTYSEWTAVYGSGLEPAPDVTAN